MHKILVVTDLHLLPPGGRIIGLDPAARLRSVLERAAHDHPDAARLIVTGDLTHNGLAEEYSVLQDSLAGLPWPVSLMLGNHDRRQAFAAAFPETPRSPAGHVQEIVDLPGWRLVTLDSLDEDAVPEHSGVLCAERMEWLGAALQGAGSRRVVVFVHHPPIRTFFNGMDDIGLRNGSEMLALLERHGSVAQIVAGHIHRTISGSAGNLPVAVFKSPCHQMPLRLASVGSHHSVDEPAAFGVLLLHDDGVTVHTEDVF